jgi:hypothetical protein
MIDSLDINFRENECEAIIKKGNKIIKTLDNKDVCKIYYSDQGRKGEIIFIKYFLFNKKIFEQIRYIYSKNNVFITFEKIRRIPKIFEEDIKAKYLSSIYKEITILAKRRLIAFLNDDFSPIDFIKNFLEEGGKILE